MKILVVAEESNQGAVQVKAGMEVHDLEPGAQAVLDVRQTSDIFVRGEKEGDSIQFFQVILKNLESPN